MVYCTPEPPFVKTTYCKHGVVVICQSDSRGPRSTAALFFRAALGLGFGSSFGPHWHERLESLIRKHLLAAWLPVMALHEASQARSSRYPQDPSCICLQQTTSCTCSVSTQQHRRSVHTVISQGNAALFCQGIGLFRASSCQGFETKSAWSIFEVTQTDIPALLGWDASSAREAP